MKCNNCGHEIKYTPRSPRDGKVHGTTRSQDKMLDKIRVIAANNQHRDCGYTLETRHLDSGPMSVTLVINPDETLLKERFHLFISRRGKVEIVQAADGFGDDPALVIYDLEEKCNAHDER